MNIKKAVIPVAGKGTRFLPASKEIPKEMIPIINIPMIHYVVKEAVNSGIEHIIFVSITILVTAITNKKLNEWIR